MIKSSLILSLDGLNVNASVATLSHRFVWEMEET